jgi:hypothetical protein
MRTSTLIAALGLIVFAGPARAGLKWEQAVVELHPKPGDDAAVGTFKYHNAGNKVVHVKSVHTSCGCTTTNKLKDDIAPDDRGELTATFKIGSSTGMAQKTITVETDDPEAPTTVLTLRAVIPQMVELRPSFVYWENSEPAKPKVITVKTAREANVKKVDVVSSSPEFAAKVTPAGANEFKVEVQPKDTSHASIATLTITPDNGVKPVYARARVVNPASSQ